MKKILKRILSVLPFIFLLLAIILIVQLTVSIKRGDTPNIFGRAAFIVVSPSMEDTIMTGDVIFVDTKAAVFHVGDIITYHRPDDEAIIITHRIVEIQDENGVKYYTTKGDNNAYSLDWEKHFSQDEIIGKYLSKSTFIGTIYDGLFSGGINLVFGGIVLIFIVIGGLEVANIVKSLSQEKQKKLLDERERLVSEELEKLKQKQEEQDKL